MVAQFDIGSPTLRVNVYETGELVAHIACESAIEAAEVINALEARNGVKCEVEDLATRHGAEDVLTPEPEDALDDYDDGTS